MQNSLTASQRFAVISAALLALFLGALDALVISAAMPTVVAELGGMHLYSWVYSVYFLARAVSLPIFGKLSDLHQNRTIFLFAIALFLISSVAAGFAPNMAFLIVARVFQGMGAGGIFALVYVVLADVSTPENRGRTLSFASSIWGIASVLGPTLGGFIVTYFSWRWIFFVNVPLGLVSLWGIGAYLVEMRPKKEHVTLDFLGVALLTTALLAFLSIFLLGGRQYPWLSLPMTTLVLFTLCGFVAFVWAERRAKDPILSIDFFANRSFSAGNGAVFLSSFAIFPLFAFAPLFIQGVQGQSPMQVGLAMLSLSLGWSVSSILLGLVIDRMGFRKCAVAGAVCLIIGSAMTLLFTAQTTVLFSFSTFFIVGMGMGVVALATLLVVQSGMDAGDLGVATSSNQFARTLGGTVGVGVCGGFIANRFAELTQSIQQSGFLDRLPEAFAERGFDQIEQLFRPEIQAILPPELKMMVHAAIGQGIREVFWTVLIAAIFCLVITLLIPSGSRGARTQKGS